MNILSYDKNNQEEYYKYLLSIGFSDQSAKEVINRMNHNRADGNDKSILKRYNESKM